jgi:hypothetical protein
MRFFERLSNGWKLSMNSFKVLKENKQLIVFPLLSGLSLILIMGSFITFLFIGGTFDEEVVEETSTLTGYLIMFGFYLVNYFIVVFFNMALVHCTRMYFSGEEVSIEKGLKFSLSRIGVIFSWAVFAATVGTILKAIQENSGIIGKIITGLLGIVWSVATFFVIPVIAYENVGPLGAFKRSSQMMKEKWGEGLAGTFSFGIIQFIAILLLAIPMFLIGITVHPLLGIALAVLGAFVIITIISAAETIFISAVYHDIKGDPVKHFNQQMVENLFVHK